MRRLRLPLLVVFAGLAGLGCQSGPKLYDVSGTVSFDGKPVGEGEIIFISDDNSVTPDAGRISDGTFHFQAKAGKKKVKILASRKIPGKGAMGEDYVYQSYIPRQYNDLTTLEAEVTPSGPNHFEFALRNQK